MRKIVYCDGVKILYNKNKLNKGTYCEFGINTGSYCDDIWGQAHYMEHLFFSETPTLSHETIQRYSEIHHLNAFTSFNNVRISFDQSSSQIEECFKICSDMMFNSIINEKFLEKERNIIHNEISQRLSRNKKTILELSFSEKLYQSPQFGTIACGTHESLDKITVKDLQEFREKWFCKENFSVLISTNKSLRAVKKLVKKYITKNLKSNKNFEEKTTRNIVLKAPNFLDVIKKETETNSSLKICFVNQEKPQNPTEKLKFNQLQNYASTMLFRHLFRNVREKKSYIYSISKTSVNTKFQKIFGVSFDVENKDIIACIKEIANTIKDLLETGFSQKEFDDYVKEEKLIEDLTVPHPGKALETMDDQATVYGFFWKQKQVDKLFFSHTLEELNNFFRKNFVSNCMYVSILTNADKKEIPTLKQIEKIFETKKD